VNYLETQLPLLQAVELQLQAQELPSIMENATDAVTALAEVIDKSWQQAEDAKDVVAGQILSNTISVVGERLEALCEWVDPSYKT
jgi:hypothetical protein